MEELKGLKIQRRLGQSVTVNDLIDITIIEIRGNQVKLLIEGPDAIEIRRTEKNLEAVEKNSIIEDLGTNSPLSKYRDVRSAPKFVKYSYGKFGGASFDRVPSYFLRYVLEKEMEKESLIPEDVKHVQLLIAESERRTFQQLESKLGHSNNTVH